MDVNLHNFVITDTSWSRGRPVLYILYGGIILLTVGVPILFFIVWPLFYDFFYDFFLDTQTIIILFGLIFWGDLVFLFCIKITLRSIKPIHETKISISNGEFKIYIQNKIYLQIFLNQLEKIEFIRERWPLTRYINFISPSITKEVLLYLFIFKKKKKKLIFNYLKQVAQRLNIKLIERWGKRINLNKIVEIRKDIKKDLIAKL